VAEGRAGHATVPAPLSAAGPRTQRPPRALLYVPVVPGGNGLYDGAMLGKFGILVDRYGGKERAGLDGGAARLDGGTRRDRGGVT